MFNFKQVDYDGRVLIGTGVTYAYRVIGMLKLNREAQAVIRCIIPHLLLYLLYIVFKEKPFELAFVFLWPDKFAFEVSNVPDVFIRDKLPSYIV